MADEPDLALVDRFLEDGDETAFRELYRRHAPVLYLLALRLLGGRPADAEEAVQEAWIRAASGFAAFRGSSSLRTWLCGTVVNCCREHRRARGREGDAAESWLTVSQGAPAAWSPSMIDLERAVTALPDGYREVLVLHDVYGYTHDEIGALLRIEAGTSKSQLHHARRRVEHAIGSTSRS